MGETIVEASGIVTTPRKSEWNKRERLRRLETMFIKDTQRTDSGYTATVVDGGAAISHLEMIDGRFILKTSWSACITVGKVNQPIEEESDLKSVLFALKKSIPSSLRMRHQWNWSMCILRILILQGELQKRLNLHL